MALVLHRPQEVVRAGQPTPLLILAHEEQHRAAPTSVMDVPLSGMRGAQAARREAPDFDPAVPGCCPWNWAPTLSTGRQTASATRVARAGPQPCHAARQAAVAGAGSVLDH